MSRIAIRATSEASRLQRRVLDELEWDSAVDTSRMQISVDRGSQVTLHGAVHTLKEKCRVEDLVKRIRGVAGVFNRLEVRLSIGDYRTDATLARVLGELFDCLAQMPEQRPRIRSRKAGSLWKGRCRWDSSEP
jgi:Predicted periplasmic or secreted lipoprotein